MTTKPAKKPKSKTITGAELLCQCLVDHGVELMFGYQGGAIMPVYDAFPKYPKLRHVMVRNEQGAAFAAAGYARATGKVGVCVATSGPGATNLLTGIADAHMDSIPVLAITGQVVSTVIGTDAFQESDVVGLMIPLTKQSYLLDDVHDIPMVVSEAFHLANSGRPGPVHIDLPKDVAFATVKLDEVNTQIRYPYEGYQGISVKDLKTVQSMVKEARQPVVFVGHGVILSNAHREVQQFIEKSDMPFASTLLGISALPYDHPLHLGMMGMHGTVQANRAIEQSDLIIAFGMRFDDRITGLVSAFAPHAKIIHIEIDPSEIDKNVKTNLAINCDIKKAAAKMTQIVVGRDYTSWKKLARDNAKVWDKADPVRTGKGLGSSGKLLMAYVLERLSDLTHGNDNVVADVGQNQMFAARYYNFQRYNTWFNSGGAGTMGFALPTALGVKMARPKERVWVTVGDGGFQMNIQELGTILEEKLDIKILLLNNSFLGMVKQWQDLFFGGRFVATPMVNPDFVALCRAYGIAGEKVATKAGVDAAIKRAMQHKGAYIVEVDTAMEEVVMPMIPSNSPYSSMRITNE